MSNRKAKHFMVKKQETHKNTMIKKNEMES